MGLAAFNRMRALQQAALMAEQSQTVDLPTANGYGVPIDTVFPKSYAEYTKQEIIDMNAKEQKAFIEQHELAIEGYKSMKAPELETALLAHLGLVEAKEVGEVDANTNN